MSEDSSSTPGSSTAIRRLLSSNHSIYSTLTDPQLECAVPPVSPQSSSTQLSNSSATKEAEIKGKTSYRKEDEKGLQKARLRPYMSPQFDDSLASFSSWQSIHLPSLHDSTKPMRILSPFTYSESRPTSASVLSNSSEEDGHLESVVIVPSLSKQVSANVLLFETDEEEDHDEDSGISEINLNEKSCLKDDAHVINSIHTQRRTSVRTDSSQTFIMPKMSLSEEVGNPQLTVVSSKSVAKNDIDEFIGFLQNLQGTISLRYAISHISLASDPSKEAISVVRGSDVLIILNDGCKWISDLTESMVNSYLKNTSSPILVVINFLSTNYFGTLFDIIRWLKPSQNIKCTNLRDKKFLKKLKAVIQCELGNYKFHRNSQVSVHSNQDDEYMKLCWTESEQASSQGKPNYKSLRRNILQELRLTTESYIVDPLYLSSGLGRLTCLAELLTRELADCCYDSRVVNFAHANREALWILCSFSLGIGLGLTLDAMHVFSEMKRVLFLDASHPLEPKPASPDLLIETIGKGLSKIMIHTISLLDSILTDLKDAGVNFEILRTIVHSCIHLSQAAFDSAVNGFIKVTSLFCVWVE